MTLSESEKQSYWDARNGAGKRKICTSERPRIERVKLWTLRWLFMPVPRKLFRKTGQYASWLWTKRKNQSGTWKKVIFCWWGFSKFGYHWGFFKYGNNCSLMQEHVFGKPGEEPTYTSYRHSGVKTQIIETKSMSKIREKLLSMWFPYFPEKSEISQKPLQTILPFFIRIFKNLVWQNFETKIDGIIII